MSARFGVILLLVSLSAGCMPGGKETTKKPMKLFLPKDEEGQVHHSTGKEFVVLVLNEQEVYGYNGTRMQEGRKYTYNELGSYLASKKADHEFFVVIKPGEKATYKSTVDMLDLMTVGEVKHYSIEDATAEEEALMKRLN